MRKTAARPNKPDPKSRKLVGSGVTRTASSNWKSTGVYGPECQVTNGWTTGRAIGVMDGQGRVLDPDTSLGDGVIVADRECSGKAHGSEQ